MVDTTEKLPLPCSNPPLTYGQVIPIKFCGLTPPQKKKIKIWGEFVKKKSSHKSYVCVKEGSEKREWLTFIILMNETSKQ